MKIEILPTPTGANARNDEYIARLSKCSDEELIGAFNREVGNTGWTSSRASYLAALYREFKVRGFDCTTIGDGHSFSPAKHVRLTGKTIEQSIDQ
jgi:hypothetical protein